MDVCLLYFVLSVRGPCVGLITHPEYPRECGVSECDGEASIMKSRCSIGGG